MADLSRWARAAIEQVARLGTGGPLDRALRITINFHPDRPAGGRTVIERLADERVYRSQFETGISNGGLTAHPGGDRWRWERRIFAGAYDDAPPVERPKYGALNHRRLSVGGAVRFGSCHLRLDESALDRATFCFPDSAAEPTAFGTAARCDLISRGDLTTAADAVAARPHPGRSEATSGGQLDGYVEAQVHGPIEMPGDVEAIVLDPCYAGTEVERVARRAHPVLEWTEGRVLTVAEFDRHPEFRGPDVITIGRDLAEEGMLTARVIGDAARRGAADPQDLKRLWHLVARFGASA